MRNPRFLLPGFLVAVILSPIVGSRSATGDLLTFKNGASVQLPAEVEGQVVRVIGPLGPQEFLLEDFRAIVPGHWPPFEWPERRELALADSPSQQLQAAWWALEHGLTDEAVSMLRSASGADSSLEPAARLVSVIDRFEQPARSPNLAALRSVLPSDLTTLENARIILLHQHSPEEAAARLDLLDRVLTSFVLTFSALGFDLQVPPEKLVAVWLAEEADYLDFIRKEAGPAFLKTRGYYHPTRRVVFAFDGRSRAEFQKAMSRLAARLDELNRVEGSLVSVPPNGRLRVTFAGDRPRVFSRDEAPDEINRLRRETRRDILTLELDRLQIDQAAAVHELIHQAVIATGLAPRFESFPVWLHEGIATQFEAFRGADWAGLVSPSPHRLDRWRALRTPPHLDSLLRDEGFDRGYSADHYAAAWALLYHLRSRNPHALVSLIDQLRNPGLSQTDSPPISSAFRSAIGADLTAFRLNWFDAMRSVRLPTESETPRVSAP